MNRKTIQNLPISLFIGISVFATTASADSRDDFNSWQNTLAPLYIWAQSLTGEMVTGPVTAPVDIEFKDAISDLEATYTIHYEGAKGHYGFLLDYSFLNLTPSSEIADTDLSVDVDMKNTIAEAAGMYRFGPDNPWQILLGYRSYHLDIKVEGPLPTNGISIDETFNDIFIGGRYVTRMTDRWTFTGRADAGTGDSDLVWHASVALDYKFNDVIAGLFGWRIMDYDVDQGSGRDRLQYKATHSGPLFALAFRW